MTKRILIFDLIGQMAHFRKFYTNSSSLSYTFPPRTVITGLIAGIIGRTRDSYYEEMNSQNCKTALSIKNPLRKIMQCVNYVRTKTKGELNACEGRTQIPLEIILPDLNSQEELIRYRVYFTHKNEQLMEEVKKALLNKEYVYPPYLGISEFIAETEFIADTKAEQLTETHLLTVCVINSDYLEKGGLDFKFENKVLQYIKERMPLEFASRREIKAKANFIYEKNAQTIKVKLGKPFYQVEYSGLKENVCFMEG